MTSRNAKNDGEAEATLRKSRRVNMLLLESVSPSCHLLFQIAHPFQEPKQVPLFAPGEAQNVN